MNNAYGYNSHGTIKNFKCLRTVTSLAGAFGIAQSLIWIALTIVGILAYNCIINTAATFTYDSVVGVIFLDIYFKGKCTPDVYANYNHSVIDSVTTILNPDQILIWDSVYLAVAVCWLLASVLLLTHVKKSDTKLTAGIIYTWVIVTLCISLMDLALGVIFGIDYSNFSNAAADYNLSSIYPGVIDPNGAQLIAAMVSAISMMIISLKGFVLWLINVSLLSYLLVSAVLIVNDKDGNDTLFMPRKESDDGILTTRPPIKAYEDEQITQTSVYANEGFVPDNQSKTIIELNQESIARAARMSTEGSLQDRRFRNLDGFQQYPPPRYNNKHISSTQQLDTNAVAAAAVSSFPAPDYSPPMNRANQGPSQNGLLRNQRYQ